MKRVLIVGAGKRVLGGVLPAFACVRDRFEVAALVATSVRPISSCNGAISLTTTDQLSSIDLSGIDLIVMAVPPPRVASMIDTLSRGAVGNATLMLDTPVLPPTGLAAIRKFRAFRKVVVAEDTIALPPFVVARRLIESGAIGELRRIHFFHCGYKYHALASLKMLAGGPIRSLISRSYERKRRIKELVLGDGVTASIFEPRDYSIGRFLIEGTRGAIADYDLDPPAGRRVHRIEYDLAGPVYRGLRLDGAPVPPTGLDRAYLSTIDASVPEITPMNAMKLRGLIDLLIASTEPDSPLHYSPFEGLADGLMIQLADRLGYVPGPAHWAKALRVPELFKALG